MNLNQVTVPATDIEASSEFYRRLRLNQIVRSPHYARFLVPQGDATFSIHLAENISSEPHFIVYFECEDLDERVNDLINKGLEFYQMPRDESWLWREARIKDPAGNIICLYHAGKNRKDPPWKIAD